MKHTEGSGCYSKVVAYLWKMVPMANCNVHLFNNENIRYLHIFTKDESWRKYIIWNRIFIFAL